MTKISNQEPSGSKGVTPTGKQLSKSENSRVENGQIEQTEGSLHYLSQPQALILTALLLHPTDEKARKSLGWSLGKFYRYKKEVEPLKREFAAQAHQDTLYALSLAAKHAVSKYVELLDKGGGDFQKGVADEIMDRVGVTRKVAEETPVGPLVQNIIAQKWDKYGPREE